MLAYSLYWEFLDASESGLPHTLVPVTETITSFPSDSGRTLPCVGEIKCNVDASFSSDSLQGGDGAVFRDNHGSILYAVVFCPFKAQNASLAKAVCLRKSSAMGHHFSFDRCWFETDSVIVCKAVLDADACSVDLAAIIHDIQCVLKRVPSFLLSHVRRHGNEVAHMIAKLSQSHLHEDIFLSHIPLDILHRAQLDLQ
ncbi:uncharacterized protein LOC132272362 [Cornus florida]|uniref:uncharacterized protein LOC132272362 n=1 Tax=Cornus florida TaxID=4283 RepID=UPI002899C854|nr:uncharacterized protein LOC132272362 [Cornus florida]